MTVRKGMIRFGVFSAIGITSMLAASSLPGSRANSQAAAELRELFEKAKAEGAAVVLDVQSEHTIAAVGMGRDASRRGR